MANNKKVDKKPYKVKRLCEFIIERRGELISPTTLAKAISIHKDTVQDISDMVDSLQDAGFKTLRDKNGRLLKIFSSDEALDTRKELRMLRKEIIGIKDSMDELKSLIKTRK